MKAWILLVVVAVGIVLGGCSPEPEKDQVPADTIYASRPEYFRNSGSTIIEPEVRFIMRRTEFDSLVLSKIPLNFYYAGETETKKGRVVLYLWMTKD